jgi:single-stranded-DNA-specific exonuclease
MAAVPVGTAHLRLDLRSDGGATVKAIAFRTAGTDLGAFLERSRGATIHVAGNVQANYWNGARSVQFRIVDAAQASTV